MADGGGVAEPSSVSSGGLAVNPSVQSLLHYLPRQPIDSEHIPDIAAVYIIRCSYWHRWTCTTDPTTDLYYYILHSERYTPYILCSGPARIVASLSTPTTLCTQVRSPINGRPIGFDWTIFPLIVIGQLVRCSWDRIVVPRTHH